METDLDLKHWENVKGKLKNLFPQLTDSDLIWRHQIKKDLFDTIATKLIMSMKKFEEIVGSL